MFRLHACWLATLVLVGCGGRMFTDLGNGVAVPSETINQISQEKGITRDQARTLLRKEAERQRIAEHAETYGISVDEATEQLDHAREYHQQGETRRRTPVPEY